MHSFNKVQGCQVWFLFPRNQLSVGSQKSGCLEQAGEERLLWGRERAAAVSSIISFPELLRPSHQSPVLLTLTYPSWAGLFWDPFQPLESSDSPEQFPSVPLGSFPSSSSQIPHTLLASGRDQHIPLIWSCSHSSPGEADATSLYL